MTSENAATEAEQAYVEQQRTKWADPNDPDTVPSGDTVEADRRDADADHDADRMPTPDEEAAAPARTDAAVRRAYEAANERGANAKGEGEI